MPQPRITPHAATGCGTLDQARATLNRWFGYSDFRPPQIRAVEAVLSGRDALVVLPTGGGKSLCYQVPAMMRQGLTVVVSPLISLMKDQVEALERRGVRAAYINSTLSAASVSERMARARDGTLKLLYLAPERLDAGRTSAQLAESGVALLAVDEAHCISEWGHDFRPSYRRIGAIRSRLGSPQTVALTATATPAVRDDIRRQLCLRNAEVVVAGFDRTNLTYHVIPAATHVAKDGVAISWLRRQPGPAIVYASTRKAVERVTSALTRAGISAAAYHAGLADTVRQRAQDAFMEERARIIVATSAFGMGIDKPDVRLVVHHAMPGSLEAYYQEAGRAGRDGQSSEVVLLHDSTDRDTHQFFIDSANPPRWEIERAWKLLRDHADSSGYVACTPSMLATRMGGSTDERRAATMLRVLVTGGACVAAPPSPGRVSIRLVASPARIRRELIGDDGFDREVLRCLWRAAGPRLERGASIDLDGLPPGLGGAQGLVPVLQRLESRQFVTWVRTGAGYRLDPRSSSPAWLPIDWSTMERRRRSDTARLDAMEKYTQTPHCRRVYVLRYFGDPGVRSHCGACDRCLGQPTGSIVGAPFRRSRSWSRPRA